MSTTNDATFYTWVYGSGLLIILLLYAIYGLFSGTWRLSAIWDGYDNRPSTSKFQFALWTALIFFAYAVIYVARQRCKISAPLDDIPHNVLIALGLSIVTATAAKGITVSYVSSGRMSKPAADSGADAGAGGAPAAPADGQTGAVVNPNILAAARVRRADCNGLGCLLQDDSGLPNLSKIQMIGWTFISLAIYLYTLVERVGHIRYLYWAHHGVAPAWPVDPLSYAVGLPDIDASLLVLMGLGQGAYLGKKLVTTSVPRLTGISPSAILPSTVSPPTVTLSGTGFGTNQGGNQVLLDGVPLTASPTSWADGTVQFPWPPTQAGGADWTAGQTARIGLLVDDQLSNALPVVVQAAQASPAVNALRDRINNVDGNGAVQPAVVAAGR